MRQRYLSLIIFLFVTLCISAQIQRRFLGFTLGVASKTEMTKYFKSKGKNIRFVNGNTLTVTDVIFGGQEWHILYAHFYKSMLYSVTFMSSENTESKVILDANWNVLNNRLKKKYTNYYVESKSNIDETWYFDNKTYCCLDYRIFEHAWALSITYTDSNLENLKLTEDQNEL